MLTSIRHRESWTAIWSSRSVERTALAGLLFAALIFAAAELLVTVIVGRFFAWGRAEFLLFLAFRPWLLLVAALLIASRDWRWRAGFYLSALLLSALAESLFLAGLGGAPWPQAIRGLVAGMLIAGAIDLAVQLGLRLAGRTGLGIAAIFLSALALWGNGLRPYEALILGTPPADQRGPRPELLFMTGLPVIWGEKGAFDPASRPAASYRMLQREFTVTPIDHIDDQSLDRARLLLLAQPRVLAPNELVALDGWVRRGGRILILTDPMLVWPTDLAIGDARRAPPVGLLKPLLDHWGLDVQRAARPAPAVAFVKGKRLVMESPGHFVVRTNACTLSLENRLADCRIGKGRALILADADLMRDALWAGSGALGTERHGRAADNPLVIADLLDDLAGVARDRIAGEAVWIVPDANPFLAWLLGLAPLAMALAAVAAARFRSR